MFWGLEFHDAFNGMIVIGGEFSISIDSQINRYKFSAGTDKAWIKRLDSGEWKKIPGIFNYNFQEEIVKLLPQKKDFGFNWDYANFLIALTFWSESKKKV